MPCHDDPGEGCADTMAALELMMHMSKNDQIGLRWLAIESRARARSRSPQSMAGRFQSRPQGLEASDPSPVGPLCARTMRLILWDLLRCGDDAFSRFLKSDRTKHRLHGFGEMKSATGAAGRAPTIESAGLIQDSRVQPQLQPPSRASCCLRRSPLRSPAPIMVPEDHRQWKRQGGDPTRQPKVTVREISHKQHRIGLETFRSCSSASLHEP